ncbi:WD40/YVTN/BNR-like repeat-containing protein [Brevibacillus ginsengisoli]|uniref:WD40/YVTN/BNR-like repeat-containing protein n=1 Tax=Brevibacillus ginsengisoli TaxID=363854 RepID=UPI003CF6EA1E
MNKQTARKVWMIGGLVAALLVGCTPQNQEERKISHTSPVQAAQIPGDLTYQDVLQTGEQIHFAYVSPQDLRILLGTHAGIYGSAKDGLWSAYSPEMAKSDITGIYVEPSNPHWIYVAGNQVSKLTHDGGNTWKNVSTGLPTPLDIRSIAGFSTGQGVNLFAYVENEGIYKSSDSGEHWKKWLAVNTEVIAMDYDKNSNRLYILTQEGLFFEENGHLNQEGTPVARQMYSFSIDRDNNRIYLATDQGVMMKSDGKWESLGKQLPEQVILLASGSIGHQMIAVGESASLYLLQDNQWEKWE